MTGRPGMLAILALVVAYLAADLAAVPLPDAVHVMVGLPLVVLLPGVTLLRAVGVGAGDVLGTVLLAVGIALVETILVGLVLEFVPNLSLDPESWRQWLSLFVAAQAGAALLTVRDPVEMPRLRLRPIAAALVPLAIMAVAGVVSIRSARAAQDASFTQLWAVPAGGRLVEVGVRNNEGARRTYRLRVGGDGEPVSSFEIVLGDGEAWTRTIPIPSGRAGEAHLFLGDDRYRSVDLPVPVRDGAR